MGLCKTLPRFLGFQIAPPRFLYYGDAGRGTRVLERIVRQQL